MSGRIVRASGSVVVADRMAGRCLQEVVRVGAEGLMGEIVRLDGDRAFIQVYEDTAGLRVGQPVEGTGAPLVVELGPGLMSCIFDGIQRPLGALAAAQGPFIGRGTRLSAIDREALWDFEPRVKSGDAVTGGTVLGVVPETEAIEHRVLAPPGISGVVREARQGRFGAAETVVILEDGAELSMLHTWPVKRPRPVARRCNPDTLFFTGQRVLDTLFPIAVGGVAIVPGGFGTGKTVVEHSLAKYASADCVVYVGCGERGNEMTEVLAEFPALTDPRTGGPLMGRTVLVANTSNMPVAAREASIYVGITMAEYYRDMGYDVAMMADSTSRWAEALREISSRLEELPGEEGYPTYMAARVAQFYERAGRVEACGGERRGSVTLVAAVSPPGGDFSEPVTQSSQRVAGAQWALDPALAYRRHYPSVNWNRSYSLYLPFLAEWLAQHAPVGWTAARARLVEVLEQDARLQQVVQLVGPDALQDRDRLLLETSRMVREIFLQQNAFSPVDATCSLEKQYGLLQEILNFYEMGSAVLDEEVPIRKILALGAREKIARLRSVAEEDFPRAVAAYRVEMDDRLFALETEVPE